MLNRRSVGWLLFLLIAAVIAAVPEFAFDEEATAPRNAIHQPLPAAAGGTREHAAPAASVARPVPDRRSAGVAAAPVDLFAPHSWRVAAAPRPLAKRPPPAPATTRAPSAPPLPFRFMGRLDDGDRERVFLTSGNTVHVVGVGDVIDGTYEVQAIQDARMQLVYLPLKITQSLPTGGTL